MIALIEQVPTARPVAFGRERHGRRVRRGRSTALGTQDGRHRRQCAALPETLLDPSSLYRRARSQGPLGKEGGASWRPRTLFLDERRLLLSHSQDLRV